MPTSIDWSLVASIASVVIALLALTASWSAARTARLALQSQLATRVIVRCRRSAAPRGSGTPVVLAVAENVGGLAVTIESVGIALYSAKGSSFEMMILPTLTGNRFPYPSFPVLLEPRKVVQVPAQEEWIRKLVELNEKYRSHKFAFRFHDDIGTYYESQHVKMSARCLDVACPYAVPADHGPRSLRVRVRRARLLERLRCR
jgi:hypothetical protein